MSRSRASRRASKGAHAVSVPAHLGASRSISARLRARVASVASSSASCAGSGSQTSGERPARGAGGFRSARSTSRGSGRATRAAEASAARPIARSSSKVIAPSRRRKEVAGTGGVALSRTALSKALFFTDGGVTNDEGAKRSCTTTPSARSDPSARSVGASPTWHVRACGNVTRDSRTSVPARKRTSAAVAVPVPPVASSSRTRHSRGGWSATTRRRTRRPARDAALETRTVCCCRLGSRSRVTDPTSRSSPPEVAHATTETTASPSAAPIESSSEAPVSEGDIARVPDRPRDERVPSGREGRSRPRNERARTSAAARARRCVLRHDRTSRRMRPLGETQKRFSGRPEKTLRLLSS